MSSFNTIKFGRITRAIDFEEYDPNWKDAPAIHVWVNLPVAVMDEFNNAQTESGELVKQIFKATEKLLKLDVDKFPERKEEINVKLEELTRKTEKSNKKIYAWYAKIWSQHEDKETHVTAAKLNKWIVEIQKADPGFWKWLQNKTLFLITYHTNQHLKNLTALS